MIAGTAQTTANAVNRRSHQRAAAAAPQPSPAVAPPPPPAPTPPVPALQQEGDLVSQLSRLAQLRDDGVLTEAEFQVAKNRLLA